MLLLATTTQYRIHDSVFSWFRLGGALLNAGAEHAAGKSAVLELHFPAGATSEFIWAERQAAPTSCELRCGVVRVEGLLLFMRKGQQCVHHFS